MSKKNNYTNNPINKPISEKDTDLPGYPIYPPSEDIYNTSYEDKNIDLEDLSKLKNTEDIDIINYENYRPLKDDIYGDDLDVPGSELDDDQEKIGNEDEENNYYSISDEEQEELIED